MAKEFKLCVYENDTLIDSITNKNEESLDTVQLLINFQANVNQCITNIINERGVTNCIQEDDDYNSDSDTEVPLSPKKKKK